MRAPVPAEDSHHLPVALPEQQNGTPPLLSRWRPHPWHGLAAGRRPPTFVNAFIEIIPLALVVVFALAVVLLPLLRTRFTLGRLEGAALLFANAGNTSFLLASV